jgi:hypothetical protein
VKDVITLLIVFSVPLTWLAGRYYLKLKQLQLESGKNMNPDLEVRLMKLEKENAVLKTRVETLETIATGGDARQLGMEQAHKLKELEAALEVEKAFKK